jgi:hypothetical protein
MKLPEAVELDLALTQSLNDKSGLRPWSGLLSMKRQGKKNKERHCLHAEQHGPRITLCL